MTELHLGTIDALEFADIWNKFDIDRSGYIEGNELNSFFYDLSKTLLKKEPTDEEFDHIKKSYMSAYHADNKISMNILAKMLLHPDETFLLLFRRKIPLESSVSFMKIWRKYDHNSSGFLNVDELRAIRKYDNNLQTMHTVSASQNFIADYVFIAGAAVTDEKLQEYAQSIMKLFDRNGDGLLDLQDMARLVNVSENFLLQFKIQDGSLAQRRRDFEKIFNHYDQSHTGTLEGAEVDGFIKDMMETMREPISASELDLVKEKLLSHLDRNHDQKIQKNELAICLGVRLK